MAKKIAFEDDLDSISTSIEGLNIISAYIGTDRIELTFDNRSILSAYPLYNEDTDEDELGIDYITEEDQEED